MRINYADEIIRMVEMREVAELYGLHVNRAGFANCPFHGEKKPSLKIYDGHRGYCCFGCGKSGNVINFIMDYAGMNFFDACKHLNDVFRLGLPIGKKLDLRAEKAAREAFRAREQKRREELEKKNTVYNAYDKALDIWCACDLILIHAPAMSQDWALAAKYRDMAAYNLDAAEGRLYEYEHAEHAN